MLNTRRGGNRAPMPRPSCSSWSPKVMKCVTVTRLSNAGIIGLYREYRPAVETVCALTRVCCKPLPACACCQLHSATNRNDDAQWATALAVAFTNHCLKTRQDLQFQRAWQSSRQSHTTAWHVLKDVPGSSAWASKEKLV